MKSNSPPSRKRREKGGGGVPESSFLKTASGVSCISARAFHAAYEKTCRCCPFGRVECWLCRRVICSQSEADEVWGPRFQKIQQETGKGDEAAGEEATESRPEDDKDVAKEHALSTAAVLIPRNAPPTSYSILNCANHALPRRR